MPISNCKHCGRLFSKNLSDVCRECLTEEQDKISHLSKEREAAREKVEGLLSRVDRLISPQAGIGKG